jgi:hypothetical protein
MQALSDIMISAWRFAMQKVVGSSPIIRFKKPANRRVMLTLVITENETLSQNARPTREIPRTAVRQSPRRSAHPGLRHWAIEVDYLDQAFAQLSAAGAQPVSPPRPPCNQELASLTFETPIVSFEG